MPITSISTDGGTFPRIVRIISSDNFSTITAAGYLKAQLPFIEGLQNGPFQWTPNDFAAITYAGGKAFFSPDYKINYTFVPLYASSGGGFMWNDVTTGSASAVADNGYMADSTSLTTITLPASPVLGDTYKVLNVNTGGFRIVYNAGQSIDYGNSTTTTTTGSLSSSTIGDELTITAKSATSFFAYGGQGSLVGA